MIYYQPRLKFSRIFSILFIVSALAPVIGYAQWSSISNYSGFSPHTLFAVDKWETMINRTEDRPEIRHEHGYAEALGKFYLIGGRGGKALNIFDPVSKTWSVGADIPGGMEIHHFQAVNFRDKIYVIGAFTGAFPNERPLGEIFIYDPLSNSWTVSPHNIPQNRRRGAAGTVVYNNRIYLVGGIINGHQSGWVNWMDEYDPLTGEWKILPDAPHERDHFHAVVVKNNLYALGGRKTGFSSLLGDTDPTVDVYNFASGEWNTLPEASNLPTPRAGAAGIATDTKIYLIGGESHESPAHQEVEVFDPATGKWTSASPLLNGRHGIQAVLFDDRIYVASGMGFNGSSTEELDSQEFYDLIPRPLSKAPVVKVPITNQKTFMNSSEWTVDATGTFSDDLDSGFLTLTITRNSNPRLIPQVTINGNLIKLTIADSLSGNSVIRVRATDTDNLFAEDEFVISVTPKGPTIVAPVPDQRLRVNSDPGEFNLASIFTDDKGLENLSFSVSLNTNTKLIDAEINADNKLILKPKLNQTGTSRIRVRATDSDRMIVDDDFLVTVITNPSKAPYVINPLYDRRLKENSDSLVIPLSGVFADDRPASEIKLNVSSNSNPGLLRAEINRSGNLVLYPEKGKTGMTALTVTATDLDGLTGEEEFSIEVTAQPPAPGTKTLINAGASYLQPGKTWITDTGYIGGQVYGSADSIVNSDDQLLYQTERWGDSFGYQIPLLNGEYKVILHFAEIYWKESGKRIFNVNVETGQGLLNNYDIYSAAGGSHKSVTHVFEKIRVSDGKLDLSFVSVTDNAKVSGIEIVTMAVDPINEPPSVQIPIPDKILPFSADSTVINIYKVFSDDQGAVLLNLSLDEPTGNELISMASLSGSLLKLSFKENTTGSATIRLRATDKPGLTATEEFRIIISEPPVSAPVLTDTIPDQFVQFNEDFPVINLRKIFKDNRGYENLTLTIESVSDPSLMNAVIRADSVLTLTNKRKNPGTTLIRIRAADVDGLIAEDSFYATIAEKVKSPAFSLRLNCGGPALLYKGEEWQADSLYKGGFKYINPSIQPGNSDFELYRTERYGNLSYEIPVPQGRYLVRLHFAEIYWSQPGMRIFNADIEQGQGILNSYDILEETGGAGKVIIEEFKAIEVKDGLLSLRFDGITDQAKISAIEILTDPDNLSGKRTSSLSRSPEYAGNGSFTVYPNPNTTGVLNIRLPGIISGEAMQLSLIDIHGKSIFNASGINQVKGRMTVQLPSSVAKGTYFMIIRSKTRSYNTRIIYQ